jgi:AcrR family transcriptional regulator
MTVPVATRGQRMASALRREQILTLATELFAEHGFHHISMDDIADRAGATKPVLYRHFPSKLDLYLAVIDARADVLVAAVDDALAPARAADPADVDGREIVRAVVDAYVTFARCSGHTASLIFESDVTRDEGVRERVLRPDLVNAAAFADVLVRLIGMTPDEAAVLGRTCTAVARSAAAEVVRADAERVDAEHGDLIAGVVATFAWRGLRSFTVSLPGVR